MFKCYICGKEYEKAIDAANCTIKCHEKTEQEEAKKKELLKVLKDTITSQYTGLKNNIKKYNELSNTEELEITLITNSKSNCTNNTNNTKTENKYRRSNDDVFNTFMTMLKEYL